MSCGRAYPASTSPSSSNSGSEKERVKRWHPKTRAGCVVCKARRVKCDLQRPSCKKCLHIGKPCVYDVPRALIFESRKNQVQASTFQISTRMFRGDNYALNVSQYGYEWISDFCRSMETYERFWTYHFPQLCEYEPALGHMELSLAARYKSAFHPPSTVDHGALAQLASKHHSESMRQLTLPGRKVAPEIMLIGCIVFMTFESTGDAMANSYMHLQACQNILREWRFARQRNESSATRTATDLIESIIQPILSRIEPMVNPIIAAKALSHSLSRAESLPPPRLPDRFDNVTAAVTGLRHIASWLRTEAAAHLMFLRYPFTELHDTVRLCKAWQDLLEEYKENYFTNSEIHKFLIQALEVSYDVIITFVKCTALPNEMVWGLYSDELGAALRQCQSLFSQPLSDTSIYLDLLPRLGPAVFATAFLSRRLYLQRQARELLQDIHRSCHGPGDECFMVRIVDAQIDLVDRSRMSNEVALLRMSERFRILKAELIPNSGNTPGRIILTHTKPVVKPVVRTQVNEVSWNSDFAPPSKEIWMWPPIELLKFAGPAGLLGSTRGECVCRIYGARPEDLARVSNPHSRPSPSSQEEVLSQIRRESEGTVFELAMRQSQDS